MAKFNSRQKEALRQLGLSDAEIDELEQHAATDGASKAAQRYVKQKRGQRLGAFKIGRFNGGAVVSRVLDILGSMQ